MDTIYLKITVTEKDTVTDEIRDQALFFLFIAEALSLPREAIEEIDDTNYLTVIEEIKEKCEKLLK